MAWRARAGAILELVKEKYPRPIHGCRVENGHGRATDRLDRCHDECLHRDRYHRVLEVDVHAIALIGKFQPTPFAIHRVLAEDLEHVVRRPDVLRVRGFPQVLDDGHDALAKEHTNSYWCLLLENDEAAQEVRDERLDGWFAVFPRRVHGLRDSCTRFKSSNPREFLNQGIPSWIGLSPWFFIDLQDQ
ncbi:MAG TPA: hypothetical protein VKM55_24600 [Candidatus Lokiarchaeia archaeon]|nr:hypothetical protein [Candidatus Lokiarchaeia archaeon]